MVRILPIVLAAGLAVGAFAQDDVAVAPSVTATLSVPRSVVSAGGTVEFVLAVTALSDATIPGTVLTGTMLEVSIDGKAGPKVSEAGTGGDVKVAGGTRIERRIQIPAARFVPNASTSGFSTVAVQWTGLTGANCVFKIAPDASKLDLATLDLTKTQVVLVTNFGEMTLSFRPDKAPEHVKNFLKLAQSGFYDGTKFHRVIRNFMIQGGDPNTKDDKKRALWGQGDPGYKINAEFNDTKHVRGVLSMARSADPNSAGSQFFIVHRDSTHLDNQYTAFGNLAAGADTLDAIANTPCAPGDAPLEPVMLHAAVILPVTK